MFIEQGIQNIFSRLTPVNSGSASLSFPPGLNHSASKVGNTETIHQWFTRCLGQLQLSPDEVWINERLAIFLHVKWKRRREITFISCQSIVALEQDLSAFYLDPSVCVQYYRLDYHPEERGNIFTHPVVHLHSVPDGSPRFPVPHEERNVIADHIDFLYRNYFPDRWSIWLKETWEKTAEAKRWRDVPFDAICEKFKSAPSQKVIEQHAGDISKIRQALQEAKAVSHDLRLPDFASTLDYQ